MDEVKNGAENKQVLTENEQCPNCGNNLKFDPKTQSLYCEYCETSVAINQNFAYEEKDLNLGVLEECDWQEVARAFECENCGARVVLDKNERASNCPFCNTPHVVDGKAYAGVKPNVVVPFSVSQEQASESLTKWAKKKFFAPSKFKKKFSPENLKGVYMPCFTFDSNTFSTYHGRIGNRYTRTVGSGKNRRTESYIVWRTISGNFSYFFDDVTITAGDKLTDDNVEKTGGFPSENNRVYDDKYLYGFMAYAKTRRVDDCWAQARGEMDARLKRLILNQYSYDVVDYVRVTTKHSNARYKHTLVPVYVGNFKYGKKDYNFISNGVTSKCDGKTPVSPIKVSVFSLFIAGILALLYFLLFT